MNHSFSERWGIMGPINGPQIRLVFTHMWEVKWKGYRGKCFFHYSTTQWWAFSSLSRKVDSITPSGV